MKTFKVKLGYKVSYETEIDIDAESLTAAMDVAIAACKDNALPPFKETHVSPAALVSVSEKDLTPAGTDV